MTDRTVLTRLKADISDYNAKMLAAAASTKAFTKELNTGTDRSTMMVQSLLAVAPALVPIGAAAVPAISGLTNQLAFAAAGAGVAALAFSGVGDALKAVNDYQLEPTTANFEKMSESMRELGPAGREFVTFLQQIRPELQGLQDAAQEGLFPGAEQGISELMELLPQAERIVSEIASSVGDLIAEAGDNLNDPRWVEFFTFLENEARPTLIDMGRTLGNFAEGFANLWMAFDPMSDDFSKGFLQMSRDFAAWTDGLSETEDFQEFLDYVATNGPKAWETLGAVGGALLEIVEAAAPVGSALLPVIETMADTIATIADSDLGPAVIGIVALTSAYSRLIALGSTANASAIGGLLGRSFSAGQMKAGVGQLAALTRAQDGTARSARDLGRSLVFASGDAKVRAGFGQFGKYAAGAGVLGFAMSDLDEKFGLSNAAMGASMGLLAGPWGAAVGGGVGLVMDLASANDDLWSAVDRASSAVGNQSLSLADQNAALDEARQKVFDLQDTLSGANGINLKSLFAADKNAIEGLFGQSDLEEANSALAELEAQQHKNAEAAMAQQFAEAGMSTAMRGASAETREQTSAILDLIAEHNRLTDATLASSDANIAYEQALDDAAKAGREGKDGLDANTQVGRDNLTLLNRLAGGWNNLSEEQQNAKGASERARSEFIRIAVAMGATRKRAKELANEYLDMPTNVSTNVKLNGAEPATRAARDLRAALMNIPGLTTTTIRTIEETFIVPKRKRDRGGNNPAVDDAFAGGGFVRGSGTTTSDSIPAWLSDKEFVVKASSVEKYGVGMMNAINAGHFANGGYVRPTRFADGGLATSLATPSPAVDNQSLARAVGTSTAREMQRVFKQGVRIVGSPGNQRLELMGA